MFVILGIVIVAIVLVVVFLRKDISAEIDKVRISRSVALQQKVGQVTPFVSDCIGSTVENAILKVFARGGYNSPKNAVEYEYYTIPVYFDKGKETVPSVDEIEKEVEKAVEGNIRSCANFNALKFPVTSLKQPNADVSFGRRIAEASLEWQLRIGAEEESAVVSEFSGETRADLLTPYEHAIDLYNRQKAIKVLSLIDLARLAKQKDYILHFDMADDAMVYLLTFNTTIIKGQPLVYTFAIRQEKEEGESRSLLAGARASRAESS